MQKKNGPNDIPDTPPTGITKQIYHEENFTFKKEFYFLAKSSLTCPVV
jgi:hypothetical protein